MTAEKKVAEAIQVLVALGFPPAQNNERSGLTLLALLQLLPDGSWQKVTTPPLGVRAILDFCRQGYARDYAENTRESIRKETLHQFVAAGLAVQNPDDPSRSPNSPKWCYQLTPEATALLRMFGTPEWNAALQEYRAGAQSLSDRYRKVRAMSMVPCTLPDGGILKLSPGEHSELIRETIEQFAPRFAPGGKVLYVGDTGAKGVIFDEPYLAKLGVVLHGRGKMPDVIIHSQGPNWLLLIEVVTSVGPVDGKRRAELAALFRDSNAGLVYVTAFQDREEMSYFLKEIAWETEVWVASDPDHLMHFNGTRFLGPYKE